MILRGARERLSPILMTAFATGLAIVPLRTVSMEVARQTLAAVEFEELDLYRPLAAIYKKSKPLSPAVTQFLAALKGDGSEELP